jgi:hypothetical protein
MKIKDVIGRNRRVEKEAKNGRNGGGETLNFKFCDA